MQKIYDLLFHIGANPSYKGYHYLAYIVYRIITQSSEPSPFLIKDFYTDAAQHFHTSPDSIQQGIRTFLKAYWTYGNGKYFQHVTGYKGTIPIPSKDFVAVLADYLLIHQAGSKHRVNAKRT